MGQRNETTIAPTGSCMTTFMRHIRAKARGLHSFGFSIAETDKARRSDGGFEINLWKMMMNIGMFIMVFALYPAVAYAIDHHRHDLFFLSQGGKGDMLFQLTIRESPDIFYPPSKDHYGRPVSGIWGRNYELKINCVERCGEKPSVFSEKTMDSPISAFRMFDGTDKFITIWAGATSYRVVIY